MVEINQLWKKLFYEIYTRNNGDVSKLDDIVMVKSCNEFVKELGHQLSLGKELIPTASSRQGLLIALEKQIDFFIDNKNKINLRDRRAHLIFNSLYLLIRFTNYYTL